MAATYGAPGVYIEERPSGSMPVQGVGTSVAAFVGFTATYNADAGDSTDPDGVKPQLVTSWPTTPLSNLIRTCAESSPSMNFSRCVESIAVASTGAPPARCSIRYVGW